MDYQIKELQWKENDIWFDFIFINSTCGFDNISLKQICKIFLSGLIDILSQTFILQ